MAAMAHELFSAASFAASTCVGLVFMLAAVQKAMHWRILPGVIANYRLLPQRAALPAAALLPPTEMAVAVLLLSERLRPWPVLAAMVLLLVFAAAMAVNIKRGRRHIDCGCGETFLGQPLKWTLVARNGVLAALLMPALMMTSPMNMPLTLSAAAAGIGLFLLYLSLNILAALPLPGERGHRFA